MNKNLFIVGIGGQAKMASNIANKKFNIKGYIVSKIKNPKENNKFLGKKIYEEKEFFKKFKKTNVFIAVGENIDRRKIYNKFHKYNYNFPNLIDDTAIIHKSVKFGIGNIVMPNSVINCYSEIKNFTIINTSSVIEHDCLLNSYSNISPNSTVCGQCFIDEGVFIGANSCIIQNIKIGNWSVVGASSTVIKNIRVSTLNIGSPSKEIKKINNKHRVL